MSRPQQAPRAMFYSHDTVGLGHLRRTLLLCEALGSQFHRLSTLIVTGSAMAHGFRISPRLDYIKLPCVTKVANEQYRARSLQIDSEEIRSLREQLILQTTRSYRPDLFVVDNVPQGMKGEILSSLMHLRRNRPEARVVLILRDILDDRSEIVPLWRRQGVFQMLEELYDRIFILGEPRVFDAVSEYHLPPAVQEKTQFCGYIPRSRRRSAAASLRRRLCPGGEKLILVTVGGGSDGARLVESYLEALPRVAVKTPVSSVVLLGPDMNRRQTQRFMLSNRDTPHLQFEDFTDDSVAWMEAADLVVSMAGYNTVSEIVWLRKKAIVLPRVFPRREQLIRAERLAQWGLVDMIHPEELTSEMLACRILDRLAAPAPAATPLPFTALDRLKTEVGQLLHELPPPEVPAEGGQY